VDIESRGWPYVATSPVIVAATATLTIEAGTVIKFNLDAYLLVDGILDLQGTDVDPVVFTSYRDDEYGGDSNDDGPSQGSLHDWRFIQIDNSSNEFHHAIVRYAGDDNSSGAYSRSLFTTGLTGGLHDCTFEYCGGSAYGVVDINNCGDFLFTISDLNFTGCNHYAINFSASPSVAPQISNININGGYGIYVSYDRPGSPVISGCDDKFKQFWERYTIRR